MAELTFKNNKTVITVNTVAIKYCKLEEVDEDWFKKNGLWLLYYLIISNGAIKLQQIQLPGINGEIATYLGTVKFEDQYIHFWFYITNNNETELLDKAYIIVTDDFHNIIKHIQIEGKFIYES